MVFEWRIDKLRALQKEPGAIEALKVYYKHNPIQFIIDWGVTYDPRNLERGLPAVIPMLLFPRQEEFCEWVLAKWRGQTPGISDKSRDMGLSWLITSLGATMCLFNDDMTIGYGSRKQEYVDKSGDPKSLFYKARMFLGNLPVEFRGGWDQDKHATHMRIEFPESGSTMTGEAGDNIGRGDRASLYFVDEAAFLMRPLLVDASLSQTTNCRIDLSSVNGMDNPFATKRHSWPADRIFTFRWTEDPRKDKAWYERQKMNIDNPVIVAQEIDLNYAASKEGILIPAEWITAAIGAAQVMGWKVGGIKESGFDVADKGKDKLAWAGRHGIELQHLDEWAGVESDIYKSTQRVIDSCTEHGYPMFKYDADGVGAGVQGDSRVYEEARALWAEPPKAIEVSAFHGGGGVINPTLPINVSITGKTMGRTNEDYYANRKAQGWWELRIRFMNTWRAVVEKMPVDPDQCISIDPNLPYLGKLQSELSQPQYDTNGVGKVFVIKTPDGMKSPNLGDAVMIAYSQTPRKRRSALDIDD